MPIFHVKSPEGKTYTVNAPEGATQAQAIAYAQKKFGEPAPRLGRFQTASDFLGDVVDNVIPNGGDEIAGAGAWLTNHLGIGRYSEVDNPFHAGQAEFKAEQARYDKNHPKLAWTSTIGGTAAGLVLPVGKVAKGAQGATRLAKAAQAAKVGALYGGASGALQGDSLAERGKNALTGAAIGGTVGAVIPTVGRAAQRSGRFLRANVPGVDPAIQAAENVVRRARGLPLAPPKAAAAAHADRMLNERMHEGHILTGPGQPGAVASPANIAAEVEHRNAMGVPAMPADTTEALRGITSWASRGQGPGQTAVREALAARKASEGTRVRQHVTDTMGPVVDPIAAVQENLAASKRAAAPLYKEAYAQPTEITPEMAKIMETPAFREAVPQAVRNIQNDMGNPRTMGFIPQADGTFISPAEGVLTTEGFDQVVRAMQQSARSAADINPITGAVTHNTNSVGINARAGDLRRELTEQNDPLRRAVSGYADEAAHRQAIKAGGDVANLTGHEVNDLARQLPADAHPSFAMGARTALADQASQYGAKFPNGDTSIAVTKSLGDPIKQKALEAIDGNRGAIPALQERLEAERQGNILSKEVLQGSKTQDKNVLDNQLDEEAAHKSMTSFTIPGAARAAWNFIAEKASTPYRNEVKKRIAQVVTETNPQNVKELMAEIAVRAQRDQDFAALMQKSGVITASQYGRNIKTDADQPTEQ